jgi:DNA adenine methylase
MFYLGGKVRLGKKIANVILTATRRRETYIEPFLGGAGVLLHLAPHFINVRASDAHKDLVLMWQAVQSGWMPPTLVSEEEYKALRHADPSALRGFVGFNCSFGGKWFGGYARSKKNPQPGDVARNYAELASKSIATTGRVIAHASIAAMTYDRVDLNGRDVVYADPPYAGTTGYSTGAFDSCRFWEAMSTWSERGADVFVSEYAAPDDWVQIWQRDHRCTAVGGGGRPTVERLFVHSSRVAHLDLDGVHALTC